MVINYRPQQTDLDRVQPETEPVQLSYEMQEAIFDMVNYYNAMATIRWVALVILIVGMRYI